MIEFDFLPVGEGEHSGDAIAVRFSHPNPLNNDQVVMVVDGGYLASGTKLVMHINDYYGTNRADLVVSTHPDADHVNGLRVVLESMQVGELFMHLPWLHSSEVADAFSEGLDNVKLSAHLRASLQATGDLATLASSLSIPITEPFAGMQRFDGLLTVLGPSREFYEQLLPAFRGRSATDALKAALSRAAAKLKHLLESPDYETLDDGGETSAENNSSVIMLLSVEDHRSLLTADAGMPALQAAADIMDLLGESATPLDFIQVPHHGSRHNVGPTILNRLLGPPVQADHLTAFVSASKDAPKHPHPQVTNAFYRRGAPVTPTHGHQICHSNVPLTRVNWGPTTPLPFARVVEVEE